MACYCPVPKEVQLRAERRAGELLREVVRHEDGGVITPPEADPKNSPMMLPFYRVG